MGKITFEADSEEELENMMELAGMEMPCLCQCGRWFDLLDGSPNPNDRSDNTVYCGECIEEEDDE